MEAGHNLVSPFCWGAVGLIFIAETLVSYRKFKRGEIDEKEFKRRTFYSAVGKVSGVLGTSLGAAGGFVLGTMIAPGVGSIAGTIIGGVSGGMILAHLTIRGI